MKKLLLSALLFCLSLPTLHAQLSPAYAARLQTVFDSVCNRYHLKGASAAVLVPGAGTWKGVFGESHAGAPITSGMLFGIGSNTKTYVAALMLDLQEDGLLSLNDTVGKWLQNKPHINGQITIRQLLNHTSGLFNYTEHPDFSDSMEADFTRVWQPEEVLQFVDAPLFAPGTSWSYSNTNYLVAGLIIKAVMNQPFEVTLRSRFLAPHGLSNTVYFPHEPANAPVPHAWYYTGSSQIDLMDVFGYDNTSNFSLAGTAGAIMATAEDNVQFWSKLISGQLITPASFNEMQQLIPLNSNTGYGLGIFRIRGFNARTIYSHGGTNIGYINENLADSLSGVCISVLTNQDSISNNTLLYSVIRALHRVTVNPPTAVAAVATDRLRVYPVPATDYIYVAGLTGAALQCGLYDAAGRLVASGTMNGGNGRLEVAAVPAGVYTLRLSDATGVVQARPVQVVK